jgi:hypothetical protein
MSLAGGFAVLANLRHRGFILQTRADRVRIAPSEHLTPDIRELLSRRKPEVLNALAAEDRLSHMSLDQFERAGSPLEIRVPWLPETLWFVPGEPQVKSLTSRGISRGRIWTARELALLWRIPTVDKKNVTDLSKVKVELGAEIVSLGLPGGTNLGWAQDA